MKRRVTPKVSNEGVTGRYRHWCHPHRHHEREIKRRNANANTECLTQIPIVDSSTNIVGELCLQQLRQTTSKPDDLSPRVTSPKASDKNLAVFPRDDGCQI